MRNEINFSQNWNNKLTGRYFTTLRLKDESRFIIGETYSILLLRHHITFADIVDIKHLFLRDINEYVAGLDSGYSADEFRSMLIKMYKNHNVDWQRRQLSLILLRRHGKKTDKAQIHTPSEEVPA